MYVQKNLKICLIVKMFILCTAVLPVILWVNIWNNLAKYKESWKKVSRNRIWTYNHRIPFRRSNQLSHLVMSPSRTQIELFTATQISSPPPRPDHILGATFASRHIISIKIPPRQSHKCGGKIWHARCSPLKDSYKQP